MMEESFGVSVELTKLRNAVVTKSGKGARILVLNLDDTDGVNVTNYDDGKVKAVYLNLYARTPKEPKEGGNTTHYLVPSGRYGEDRRPAICGNVRVFPNQNAAPREAETEDDLPF